jgi:N-acetylglutamate synthase-like GNAT family acetyltransferase
MARTDLGLTIRRATRDDAHAIADLVNRAYQVERFFVDGDRTSPEEIAELQQRGEFLVLDYASAGAAALAASVYFHIEQDRGYFGLLSVDAELQNSGIGKRLVAVAEALCEASGCSTMELQVVNLRSELPPWYRSLGYRECGTQPFPSRDKTTRPCHFILMSKQLGGVAA